MTRTLILIRHAKSDWDGFDGDDHARKLNPRGRQAAPKIGRWLADKDHIPDLMLVSDAARTLETASLICAGWPQPPRVETLRDLYLASPEVMLDALIKTTHPCVAMVAHNPGIAILAQALLARAPDHPKFDQYPTGAITIIDFENDVVAPQTGILKDFVVPRDLN
jgi:phosphohistidine phosphatase